MFSWMVSNYSPSPKTGKLLFKTLGLKPSKLLNFGGKIFHGSPHAPPSPLGSISQPARRLLHVSSTLCDTHQGKLPGSSTTSPLLLINFLVWTNRIKNSFTTAAETFITTQESGSLGTLFFPVEGWVCLHEALVISGSESPERRWQRLWNQLEAVGGKRQNWQRERTLNIRTVLALTSVAALNPHLKAPCQPHRGAPRSFLFKYSF